MLLRRLPLTQTPLGIKHAPKLADIWHVANTSDVLCQTIAPRQALARLLREVTNILLFPPPDKCGMSRHLRPNSRSARHTLLLCGDQNTAE